uniref:Endonuclease/exonuclease/phosphatase domain-containing protein n=1 Tax=Sinocyclocheilus anshuiensis TaxID=1608454 RepID=A0A671RRU2_9TELE
MMESSKEQTLCFVSWNICGQKNPKIDHYSKEQQAEIFFLQETYIGPESKPPLEKPKGWQSFFTVYDSKSKGVAILIKDGVPFQYLCHDEDYSGGYLVLFCRLHDLK